ncbi:MAG TPA: type VI secretion system baseplate subunit TssF [Caulobacteraceae bacterium]|nr:type VI secretion system baseplate subunit TssF [Caulobacteraceae bacterium]
MDPRLLRAYNDELIYLRETAREFGEEYESVAGRLGLSTPTEVDPYVERLLEGVAFLAARVNLKLQDQFPEFTQHFLQAIQPHYLAPTPSMCVVGFEPQASDQSLVTGYSIPRGTELTSVAKDQGGAVVTFRTGHGVTLWPLQITEAEYLATRAAVAPFAAAAGVRAEAGLRLRFAGAGGVPLSKLAPDELPIYLSGAETIPGELYRQVVGETLAVIARSSTSGAGQGGWVRLPQPEQVGFEDECALLPTEQRSFRGYRLLSEYFACPERFQFVKLRDLGEAFAGCEEACDVVLLFSRNAATLAKALGPQNFRLFSTPAINLFEKQVGRVQIRPYEHEFQVMPDRTRPLDFEVYRVIDVTAYGAQNGDPRPVAPLYAFGALLYDWREALFYVTRLRRRRLSTKEQRLRRRTDYLGTETWLSLTAPGDPTALDRVTELAVRALVTNRELPELLRFGGATDFNISAGPVRAVTVLRAPTRPQPPMGLGDSAWRVISHLTPNYASLAPTDHEDPAILRDHLALYGRVEDATTRRQVDGLLSVKSEHVTRRVPGHDRLAFARGLRIRLKLDDVSYENARMFLFSAVLERFLAEFATINSFTECVFESVQEGTFVQWPPRVGRRRNI